MPSKTASSDKTGYLSMRATQGAPVFNAWFFRKRMFDELGAFDTSYFYVADRELLIRMAFQAKTYPLGEGDAQLLSIVNHGKFWLNGFRNRDLRSHLYLATQDKQKQHKQMAAVGRRLRLLRAHGLIAKVPKTHRFIVTEKGRNIITALLAARNASAEKLTALAA